MVGSYGVWFQLPRSLRWTWWIIGLLGAAMTIVASIGLPADWRPATAWQLTGLAWLYFWLYSGWHLAKHRLAASGQFATRFGAGNSLTMARGWLLALLAGYLMGPAPENFGRWLPMLAYTASDIADYLDGYLARVQGLSSPLGEALDLELDSLGLLIAVAVVVHFGALPWWFLIFGIARYVYSSVLRLRRMLGLPVYELPPSKSRRPIAGMSMTYVSAALWPILDRPELTLAGVIFLTPFLGSFLRDGLVAAGVLNAKGERYQRWRQRARAVLLNWLPLMLRAGLVVALVLELPRLLRPADSLMALGLDRTVPVLFAIVLAVAGLAMVLGWAGRFMAFLAVFPMGLTIAFDGIDLVRSALVVSVLGILMLGTGHFSWWQPSDRVFGRRAGERSEVTQ